jgi:hypothetical protein
MGLVVLSILAVTSPVMAENKPIQLSLVTPIQIFPETMPISGFRFNLIYGRSVSVTGLDLGLANHITTGKSQGVQWGLVNINDAQYVGWQNGSVNYVKGDVRGVQTGIVNYANHANGLQFGLINYAVTLNGLQIGLVNIIKQGGQFPVFPIVNWSFD